MFRFETTYPDHTARTESGEDNFSKIGGVVCIQCIGAAEGCEEADPPLAPSGPCVGETEIGESTEAVKSKKLIQ